MLKKFHKKNKIKYKDYDKLNAKLLSTLSTNKHFNQALEAGCKVLIVDKENNLVEVDKTRNKKIMAKLEHPDYKLSEIQNIMKKKFKTYNIRTFYFDK